MGLSQSRKKTFRGKAAVLLVSVIAAAGCATGPKVALTYEAIPTEGMARSPDVTVGVAPFGDRRAEPEIIGEIRRGLWGSTVRPDEKIRPQQGTAATWVRDALMAELRLRGYNVVETDAKPEWIIRGSVEELFYSEGGMLVTRPGAVITVECGIVHNDRPLFVETYWNSATSSTRPGNPAQLLEIVLRRDLRKFLDDFEAQRNDPAENS